MRSLQRHERDVVSLLAGLLYTVVAVAALLHFGGVVDVDPGALLPLLLIGLGVVGLAAGRPRRRRPASDPARVAALERDLGVGPFTDLSPSPRPSPRSSSPTADPG